MQASETTLFTPTEAAVLTRLTVKAVNNAIDKKTISTVAGQRAGTATRLLDMRALMSLALERRLTDRFGIDMRRAVFDALSASPRKTVSLDGGFLKIDLREPRCELAVSLRELRRARQLVISDPEIKGGDPVFRSTRVPVHMIAEIRAKGETDQDLLASYPRLTPERVKLAPVYAAAYPLRGRPRKQPWHDQPPVSQGRVKRSAVQVA